MPQPQSVRNTGSGLSVEMAVTGLTAEAYKWLDLQRGGKGDQILSASFGPHKTGISVQVALIAGLPGSDVGSATGLQDHVGPVT